MQCYSPSFFNRIIIIHHKGLPQGKERVANKKFFYMNLKKVENVDEHVAKVVVNKIFLDMIGAMVVNRPVAYRL